MKYWVVAFRAPNFSAPINIAVAWEECHLGIINYTTCHNFSVCFLGATSSSLILMPGNEDNGLPIMQATKTRRGLGTLEPARNLHSKIGYIIIGASLSEPHTSVTSLRRACVCLLACLDLGLSILFKNNFGNNRYQLE